MPEGTFFDAQSVYKNNIIDKNMFNEYIKAKQMVILNKVQDLKLINFVNIFENPLAIQNREATPSKHEVIIMNGYHAMGKN